MRPGTAFAALLAAAPCVFAALQLNIPLACLDPDGDGCPVPQSAVVRFWGGIPPLPATGVFGPGGDPPGWAVVFDYAGFGLVPYIERIDVQLDCAGEAVDWAAFQGPQFGWPWIDPMPPLQSDCLPEGFFDFCCAQAAVAVDAPRCFSLGEAFPNPFNPETRIEYSLDRVTEIRLAVHDLLGREVAVLADGRQEAGAHEARFSGATLPSGVYLATLTGAGRSESRKLLLIK